MPRNTRSKQKKDTFVKFRLSNDEKLHLLVKAQKHRLTISDYIRKLINEDL